MVDGSAIAVTGMNREVEPCSAGGFVISWQGIVVRTKCLKMGSMRNAAFRERRMTRPSSKSYT